MSSKAKWLIKIQKRCHFQPIWRLLRLHCVKCTLCHWQWKCCGVIAYTDWHEALKEQVVPDRCCQEHYQNCGRNFTNMFWNTVSCQQFRCKCVSLMVILCPYMLWKMCWNSRTQRTSFCNISKLRCQTQNPKMRMRERSKPTENHQKNIRRNGKKCSNVKISISCVSPMSSIIIMLDIFINLKTVQIRMRWWKSGTW